MYRTARRVLNSDFGALAEAMTQLDLAAEFAANGGIENLVVFLGANNCLGTVTSLLPVFSVPSDLESFPHERKANLYLPEHFQTLYARLAARIQEITPAPEQVFLGTVPHVTIPPCTRGVGAKNGKFFEYYTRPWIWDEDFDPARHQHLTREQARRIDEFIDEYNATIRNIAAANGWHIFDTCQLLDDIAFRRNDDHPPFQWPAGAVKALKKHEPLKYLVQGNKVHLDTRFLHLKDPDDDAAPRIDEGGLFSLDGIHPTTIGYGLVADRLMAAMKDAGVAFAKDDLDWNAIVRADTLVNKPPLLMANLRDTLGFLDSRGYLTAIFEMFN